MSDCAVTNVAQKATGADLSHLPRMSHTHVPLGVVRAAEGHAA